MLKSKFTELWDKRCGWECRKQTYVLHDIWVGRHYGDTKQWNSCTAFEQNKAIMLRTKQCPYILP